MNAIEISIAFIIQITLIPIAKLGYQAKEIRKLQKMSQSVKFFTFKNSYIQFVKNAIFFV